MNKLTFTAILAAIALIFTPQVFAASSGSSHGSMDHSTHQSHDTHNTHDMKSDHGSGMKIHTATRDGYTMEYRLINMKEKMKDMKNMPQLDDTHHLMVFITDPQGNAVTKAKVGYMVQEKGKDTPQKKMAMAMSDGFGADVTLMDGHHYQIKTKVMAGDTTLMDEFTYMGGDH